MNFIQTELAWAAGFFDGEGSCHISKDNKKDGRKYKYLIVSLTQNNIQPLERFQKAVLGLGNINGPHTKGGSWTYKLAFNNFEDAQAVVGFIWKFLSPPKRNQIKQTLVDLR